MTSVRKIFLTLAAVAALAHGEEIPGLTLTPVAIPTPRTVQPYSLGAGSGRVWFTDRAFRQVGFIGPGDAITAFKLIDTVDPNNEVRPLAIVEGPDGNGWFTLYVTNSSGAPLDRSAIGRVTPSGTITIFPMPTANACRSIFARPDCGITVGPDGNIWFVETQVKKIGKLTLAGVFTEYTITASGGVLLLEIVTGADGNLWASDFSDSIFRITPSGVITEFSIPGGFIRGMTKGADGNVWFTDSGTNSIGRITPAGVIKLFPIPTASSNPWDIATGSDGKIYFTEGANNAPKLGQLDPATGTIRESVVPGVVAVRDIVAARTSSSVQPLDDLDPEDVYIQTFDGDEGVIRGTVPEGATGPVLTISKKLVDQSDYSFNFDTIKPLTRVRVGGWVLVLFKVTNEGDTPSNANWAVEDQLPAGCRFVTDHGFTKCEAAGSGVVTCRTFNPFQLKPKESMELGFICEVTLTGRIVNSATVAGGGSPPDTSETVEVTALSHRDFLKALIAEAPKTSNLPPPRR